jgi:hypothetical protein
VDLKVAITFWRDTKEHKGFVEDLLKDDLFVFNNIMHRAVLNADVKDTEVFVPCEELHE